MTIRFHINTMNKLNIKNKPFKFFKYVAIDENFQQRERYLILDNLLAYGGFATLNQLPTGAMT